MSTSGAKLWSSKKAENFNFLEKSNDQMFNGLAHIGQDEWWSWFILEKSSYVEMPKMAMALFCKKKNFGE